jgi:hypothetical protein
MPLLPTGYSQWNPIEHRLFSHISINWAGVPLRTFETMLSYIAGTVTKTRLKIPAVLKRGVTKPASAFLMRKCAA